MTITGIELTNQFFEGETAGRSGSPKNPGNLSISGDQLIHYATPILQRQQECYILNVSRYSLVTGQLQKRIREKLETEQLPYIMVKRVPEGYKGSLVDFVEKEG